MKRLVLLVVVVALACTRDAMPGGLLKVGERFPSWRLPDHTGAMVASKDLAGKTYLLWFYPKAQTPGCTAEGRGLRDRFDEFRARGVEIVGVSFDPPAANAAFVEAERFPFRLLSDSQRALANAVGAAETEDAPAARRVSYLVGPDGNVRHVYGTVTPASHAGDVLADLPGS
jgi:peroxiredoxin Q/BCP